MYYKINASILPKISYLGYVELNYDWHHFYRKVDEYILYFIFDGEMYIREDKNKFHLKKGDVLILEPNLEHEGYKTSKCSFYYVHFKYEEYLEKIADINVFKDEILTNRKESYISYPEVYEFFDSSFTFIPKLFNVSNPIKFDLIRNTLELSIEEYLHKYENYKVIASSNLLTIFINLHRDYITLEVEKQKVGVSRIHSVINQVIKYINTNLYKKFDRKELEEKFELNYDYLNRQFKKYTGYTIGKYILVRKLTKAMTLIKTSNLKISEVGYFVGIDDPYYFSKLFKRHTGLSPTEYLNASNTENLKIENLDNDDDIE